MAWQHGNALGQPPENPLFLQLSEVLDLAIQAGGIEHGFRVYTITV